MNWLKVAAVVVGGIIVFFVVDSVIHLFLGLLTALVFVAIVAGGAYAAVKINGARKRRRLKRTERDEDRQVRRERTPSTMIEPVTTRPAPMPTSTPRPDVDDDLERLKREMGH
jgi:hypothetical protein